MTPRARKRPLVVIAAVAVAAGGGWVLVGARGPAQAAPAGAAPAPSPREGARILAADPGVQRSVPGGWAPAHSGDALAVADSIRTGATGSAELQLGRGARVTVAERTEVTVRELTAAVQRVGLVRGRIGVEVERDGTRLLRVEDASGAITVTAAGGRLGVVAAPSSLAVVTSEGGATLESAGAAVEVPPGHQSAAWRGHAPLAAEPIPRALLVRAVRALEARRASVCNVVRVDVAAEVLVDGEPVDTPADGRIVLRVPPRGRRREASLLVRHAGGEVERRVVPCWSEEEPDVSHLEVRWEGR